jgi:hypothetical protein
MNDERWQLLCDFMVEVLASLPPDNEFPEGTRRARESLVSGIVLSKTDPFNEQWKLEGLEGRNAIRRAHGEREAATWDMERGGYPSAYWGGPRFPAQVLPR